mmetsp:Transcript_47093/g.105827  ORF Transcript_47093/g.105827 Transcript_47093/m.105827 type:complete len:346 (+) Transcript_47093:250-1287(+)
MLRLQRQLLRREACPREPELLPHETLCCVHGIRVPRDDGQAISQLLGLLPDFDVCAGGVADGHNGLATFTDQAGDALLWNHHLAVRYPRTQERARNVTPAVLPAEEVLEPVWHVVRLPLRQRCCWASLARHRRWVGLGRPGRFQGRLGPLGLRRLREPGVSSWWLCQLALLLLLAAAGASAARSLSPAAAPIFFFLPVLFSFYVAHRATRVSVPPATILAPIAVPIAILIPLLVFFLLFLLVLFLFLLWRGSPQRRTRWRHALRPRVEVGAPRLHRHRRGAPAVAASALGALLLVLPRLPPTPAAACLGSRVAVPIGGFARMAAVLALASPPGREAAEEGFQRIL